MVGNSGKTMAILILITVLLPLYGDEGFDYSKFSFLTESKWEGQNNYNSDIHKFEFKPFRQKEGSKLYKVRRERINYYLEEIIDGVSYIPYAKEGYPGNKIIELSRDIYKMENLVKLPDGREFMTTPTLYRNKDLSYGKDPDPLYGNWHKKSSPDEYHEYRPVKGDFQFVIFIPDYDWASQYAENGWHYLRQTGEKEFETDNAFYDAYFKLRIESENEIVLIPQFSKHDNSDGIIRLHPVKK